MAEILFLRLAADGQPASWLTVDAHGNRIGRVQYGAPGDAAGQAHGRRVRMLVPGTMLSLLHASVPTRNPQKVLQAIPFALEDRLAEDIEQLHFALGTRDVQGYRVAVLRRAQLASWLETLAGVGIVADELLPDILALPTHDAALSIGLEADTLSVRAADGTAFSTDLASAPLLIERHLVRLRNTQVYNKAVIHAVDESAASPLVPLLEAMQLDVQIITHQDGLLPLFAATLRNQPSLNLLQGTFARHTGISEHWPRWRLTAGLLLAFCVAGITQQTTAYIQLQRQASQLDAEVLNEFHKALPDVHRVVDPRAQMQQRLNQISGGSDQGPLPMLAVLSSALQTNNAVQLSGFDFHADSLQVAVEANRIDALDDLKTALQQAGNFSVSLDSVNSSNGQASGRLTLTSTMP